MEIELARLIGIRLRNAREKLGLTLEDVGESIGLSTTGYGHYERGKRLPPVDQLVKLTRVLDTSINYLLDLPADTDNLSEEEEVLLRYFRAIRDPMIRDALLQMARAGAHPGQ